LDRRGINAKVSKKKKGEEEKEKGGELDLPKLKNKEIIVRELLGDGQTEYVFGGSTVNIRGKYPVGHTWGIGALPHTDTGTGGYSYKGFTIYHCSYLCICIKWYQKFAQFNSAKKRNKEKGTCQQYHQKR